MLRQPIGPPLGGDEALAKAAVYLHRTGNDDLYEVLGLDDYLRSRQVALGLLGPKSSGSLLDAVCPDCRAGVGERCSGGSGKPRAHVSRKRLTGRIDNTEGITE